MNRSRGITGLFLLIGIMFFLFIVFAIYTVSTLSSSAKLGEGMDHDNAPIAVVKVEGVIMSAEKTVEKLLKAEKMESVKAIIVRVDSPGGAVGPTQEIYEEMVRIDKIKPIYASFGSVAASGGYYIGSAARKIFANSGTMTGSIGVIMNFMNLKELFKFAKVKPDLIKAGKYKDIGNAARDMTPEERQLLTEMTASVHEQFIQDIYKVRKDRIKNGLKGLREYAQGQIFSGEHAKKIGLVDELAGLWASGRIIHEDLKLTEKFDLKEIKLKKKFSFSEVLKGIEESVEDISYSIKGQLLPALMM